jgi:hypothetical protein
MPIAERRPLRGGALLGALLASVVLAWAASASTAEAVPVDRFTPIVASVVAPPQPVVASDGRRHLTYELLLVNRSFPPTEATVSRVTVKAPGRRTRGRKVATLAGGALQASMILFKTGAPGTTLGPGETAMVLIDLKLRRRARVPRRLWHRIEISTEPPSDVVATAYRIAPTRVSRRPAIVIAPPLRGGGWIVGNGCCTEATSHRAGLLPVNGRLYNGERFAIDFMQIGPSGLLVNGPPEQLSSYPFFGAPVLSATGGKVVDIVNNRPETPPGELPPPAADEAGGNHVTVKVRRGVFAYYAHLQPGSVRVKVGQRVRAGKRLGRLGSTGNSNAPHLHFQLMDGPSPLASNGIPYRFRRFSVAGKLGNFEELFEAAPAQSSPELRGVHRFELPLNLQVIGFRKPTRSR